MARRKGSVSYKLMEGVGFGKALIIRRGGCINGLVVGNEETFLPPHLNFLLFHLGECVLFFQTQEVVLRGNRALSPTN